MERATPSPNTLRRLGGNLVLLGLALYLAVRFVFDTYWLSMTIGGIVSWLTPVIYLAAALAITGIVVIGYSFHRQR